jgi:uncharacterized membrane protein YgcG
MEVVLALTILVGAMVVIGELARAGMHHAQTARDLTRAELICETKMAEIVSTVTSPTSVDSTPADTDSTGQQIPMDQQWMYSVDVEEAPAQTQGLLAVTVTVTLPQQGKEKPPEVTLTRWVVDPNYSPTGSTSSQNNSSGSGSSSGSGNSSSGGNSTNGS